MGHLVAVGDDLEHLLARRRRRGQVDRAQIDDRAPLRAGHGVGAASRGVFFPTSRGDLLECATVVERMKQALIEPLLAELDNGVDSTETRRALAAANGH